MKQFKIKSSDLHDLSSVVAVVVREQSEKLDFKEVISLQKSANLFTDLIKPFSEGYEKISKEKTELADLANKKISAYKEKLNKKADTEGFDEEYKKKVEVFVQECLEEAQEQIKESITPQYDALYSGVGSEEIEVKIEDDKLNLIVINFEKYAKEKYNNKSKMIEVYEALVNASEVK